tara:strand:+ start:35863 stop:36801 length:939 start_codon:yes stop_codon:yes gene_type:complete
MAQKTKRTTFFYKRVNLDDTLTLQQILESLDHLTAEQRVVIEGRKSYVLNHINKHQGMYYAEIVCSEADKPQDIIHDKVLDNNNFLERSITTKEVQTTNQALENSSSEFVNSRIIFGLSDNNLAIHSSTLKESRFILYLNNLLNTYYWTNSSAAKAITLKDVYSKDLKEKLRTTSVRSVSIGQGILVGSTNNPAAKPYELEDKSILKQITSLVGKSIGFQTTLDDSNLRVNVTIDYTRSTSVEGQKVLDDLTTSLATLDDSHIGIDFADGTDYKRGNIRMKGSINQHFLNDNSFDRSKMMKEIHSFLNQSIE